MLNLADENSEKWLTEFIGLWNTSGAIGKILIIFACIGATTTLTNLAGILVEWRGLIANILSFYSQYVRNPIVIVISFVTFDFLRPAGAFIDAMLLYLIYFSGEKRAIGKLNERSALNSSLFIMFVIVVPIVLITILLLILYLSDRYLVAGLWGYAGIISIAIPLLLIALSLYSGIRTLIWLGKGNCPEGLVPESQPEYYRCEIRTFLQFATPIVVAFLSLSIFTSINLVFLD